MTSKKNKIYPIEEGMHHSKKIWKSVPIEGKVLSVEKKAGKVEGLNFDCYNGDIIYKPGLILMIQGKDKIERAGIPFGSLEEFNQFLGEKVFYSYKKIELISKNDSRSNLHRWEYRLEIKDNPEKKLKLEKRVTF